ncbi:MAG: serine/threonine-protein kinase [Myxococcota bacterium]
MPGVSLADDRYEAGGELGRGGMGVVEVAQDAWLDREVALKRPHAELDEATRERLVREARITARLQHPGVVPVFDFGVDAVGPFYTMPVLEGRTLRRVIDESTSEPDRLSRLVRVVEAVARAVGFAHSRGIVHRDLKPENVLVGGFGEVRVLDWGVALDLAEPDTHAVGTPGFMAPEQRRGSVVGPPADVYALGCILGVVLEACGGSAALAAVRDRATRDDPGARYPDAGAFADELARWLDGRRVEAHDYSPTELLQQVVRAWKGPLAAGAVLSLAFVGLLATWATTNGWERDRARAAERVAQDAKRVSERHLAEALLPSAAAYLRAESRPSAEVLAARSLELADSPEARGVLMAWHGVPRFERLERGPLPCPDALPVSGGFVCIGTDYVRVLGNDGVERTRAPVGLEPVRAARFDGRTLVTLDTRNVMEVWRDGGLLDRGPVVERTLEPASGGLFFHDPTRVGRLAASGELEWSAPLCERVEAAWSDGSDVVVVCPFDRLVLGDFDGPREEHALGHPPSVVVRMPDGAVVVGTFDGMLLSSHTGFAAEPAGVGAVTDLAVLGNRVVVSGEALTSRLWDPATGAFAGRLPRRGRIGAAGEVTVVGEDAVERWGVPESPVVARFTRGGEGGVPFLALSPTGDALLGGGSAGNVVRWDLRSGGALELGEGCGNVAKSGVLFDAVAVATQLGCTPPLLEVDWRSGALSERVPRVGARFMERWGEHVVQMDYGVTLRVVGPMSGGPSEVRTLRGAFVAASAASDGLWLLDRDGAIGLGEPDSGVEVRFRVDGARDLVRTAAGIAVVRGKDVELRDLSGAVLWSWTAPREPTAVEASGTHVVVGDLDGTLHVLDGEGRLLASARGHERRISEIRADGDVVWTASWDGSVRRWGLAAATAPVGTLVESVASWGLSVDEVLDRPTP